jgi:translation initiation factor 2D
VHTSLSPLDPANDEYRKGQLKPISVVVKTRQGRKAVTLITDFEPYLLTAEFLAEELRRICASAASVSPIAGKSHGMEVLVQGKQTTAVIDLLTGQGIPRKWIVT